MLNMENGGAVTEERRDVATPQVQEKQQESLEVSQTDLEDEESEAGERELGALMEGSPQVISDAESVNASQTTIPKRPKNKSGEERDAVPI
jgi:hypothetical protein